MSTSRIRVGLIGASIDPEKSWGTRAHIPAIRHLPDFELTALCTSRDETARAAASHFGVAHAFSDARRMAESPEVDLVVVAVRTPLHRELVAAALAARKHVYCEWPLGVTTEEARQTLADTQAAGVLSMIGMQGRYNEAIAYARDLIAQGYIGRMEAVSVKVNQEHFGRLLPPEKAYMADIHNGATLLCIAVAQALEAVCHGVGQLRDVSAVISNQHPTAQLADSRVIIQKISPDQVLLSGRLQNGAVISVHVRGGASPATGAARLEIHGTEGDLLLTAAVAGAANIHRTPLQIAGAARGEGELRVLPVPSRYQLQPAGLAAAQARYLAHNYVAFGKALRGGAPIENDFAHGVRWQETLDTIQRASDTGQRQELSI